MHKRLNARWQLFLYDVVVFLIVQFILLLAYRGPEQLNFVEAATHSAVTFVCVFGVRFIGNIYGQIWRYGGVQCYLRLFITDFIAFLLNLCARGLPHLINSQVSDISFTRLVSVLSVNLLLSLAMRLAYRYCYKSASNYSAKTRFFYYLMRIFAGKKILRERTDETLKINIAIIGAGRIGVSLAEEITNNVNSPYCTRCFVDSNKAKAGREIYGIPVFPVSNNTFERMKSLKITEVVIAISHISDDNKRALYEKYKELGFKVKIYDYPTMRTASSKRQLREFDIDELLFRKQIVVSDGATNSYYKDKVVLITGGGGSIGSELCRQIATMHPKRIIVLDIYENGAYDIEQELRMTYKGAVDIKVEIVSVCNRTGFERVFIEYKPQVVINAAAHKHVPLMEKNCIEAIENNVFGTLNTVELSEKYGVDRCIMVSTDKAVNPTNVMGATKRMCEMIVLCHAGTSKTTTFTATRFGNVLGSAGSVIPLFKKMIVKGGPITITDKRIIRYFMTIPEASQLVLQSGVMANNGELYVLDMGKPVKILDLAENMIKLSGFEPYKDIDIVETGLRPGEKLYEELLVKTESLGKTSNSLIFVEKDEPISVKSMNEKLDILRKAIETNDEDAAREALKSVVPTYHTPEEVNQFAINSEEMKNHRKND